MRIVTPEFNLIKIGYQGENEAVCVQIGVQNWPELYGAGGSFSLRHQRAGDPDGYPVIVTEEDGTVSWVVSNIDTRDPGYGKATLIYTVGDVIAMSVEYATLTEASVGENPEPPEPWKPWIDEILEAAEDAHEDANSASDSANAASADALKAEGYAVGTQDGEAVGPDSPYYQNSAKYYHDDIMGELGPVLTHLTDYNNPHQVTKAQVGLGNADNTSDLDKPISTATQSALDGKISKVAGAVADNLASFTSDGSVKDSNIGADWLVPVKAASGSVIEFNSDAAVPLKSVLLKGKTEVQNNQLVSNNATYQLCGRNIWDEEWESGAYDTSTGAKIVNANNIRSKNNIRIIGGQSYYVKGARILWFEYDANGSFLRAGNGGLYVGADVVFTPSADAVYITFQCASAYGTTYKNDICINLSDASFNGQYEPYHDGGSIVADSLNGINAIADEQDEQGNITRQFGTVDLGTLTWTYGGGYFKTTGLDSLIKRQALAAVPNLMCPIYAPCDWNTTQDKSIYVVPSGVSQPSQFVWIKDSAYSDADVFTTAMNGVYLVYELATETTDTTTAATLTTQKGYNILRTVDGDIQNAPADIEYLNGIAAVIAEALQ